MYSSLNEIPENRPPIPAPLVLPTTTENDPEQPIDTVIRPNHHPDDQISLLWTPGIRLAELVHQPGVGLRFAVRGTADDEMIYQETVDSFEPLRWLEPFVSANAIRLPSLVLLCYKQLLVIEIAPPAVS